MQASHPDGLYFKMPMTEYLDDPALGSSDIKKLLISPLEYWENSHLNPDRPPRKDTTATSLGTLIHDSTFEPDKSVFVTKPPTGTFKGAALKDWKTAQDLAGRTIISADAGRSLRSIMWALTASGVRDRVSGSAPEVSYFWTENGFRCKIRLDGLKPFEAYDLKTYSNSMGKDTETAIAHACANYRYPISGAWYRQGIENMRTAMRGGTCKTFNVPSNFDLKMLRKMPEAEPFAHWYIFVETGGVPNVTVRQFRKDWMNPHSGTSEPTSYWSRARRDIEHATRTFAQCSLDFAPGEKWLRPVHWKDFTDEDFSAARWILDD